MKNIVKILSIFATLLILAPFTWGAIHGVLDPIAASTAFGLPAKDDVGAFFVRVYLSRNFVIIVVALVFLLRQQWASLATLMTVSILLPIFDATVLTQQLGHGAPLTIHIGTIIALALLSTLLWVHTANVRRESR